MFSSLSGVAAASTPWRNFAWVVPSVTV
ncbi:MAG: hypothetical protein DF221_08995 [Brevibacillus sp.]|nr:hypothetical protein [Brevibacillus sp. MCWH]REK64269.1 MAG: hypothetical protein DF221_08995 [Brevibacillus sp.]